MFFFLFSSSSPFFHTISFVWISMIWANEMCSVILFFSRVISGVDLHLTCSMEKGFFLGPLQPFALMIDIYSMCEMKGWQWQSRFLYLNIDIYIEVYDNPARAQHSIYAANMHKSIVHCLHIYCEWTKAIFIAQSAYTEWKLQPIPID